MGMNLRRVCSSDEKFILQINNNRSRASEMLEQLGYNSGSSSTFTVHIRYSFDGREQSFRNRIQVFWCRAAHETSESTKDSSRGESPQWSTEDNAATEKWLSRFRRYLTREDIFEFFFCRRYSYASSTCYQHLIDWQVSFIAAFNVSTAP